MTTRPADPVSVADTEASEPMSARATGLLPSQELRALAESGVIQAGQPIGEDQVQPASLDLRLGGLAHRIRASFLPGPSATVADKLDAFAMHTVDLSHGAVLEKGCVYLVPLEESLNLRHRMSGIANPKSSIGRLDVFTRLITDHADEFDRVRAGYKGPLYAEIVPRAFSVVVRAGDRLCQLRLRRGGEPPSEAALRRLHADVGLVDTDLARADLAEGRLPVSVDLTGEGGGRFVGYRAKPHTGLVDLSRIDHYDPDEFWDRVYADSAGRMILNPGDFYILASREAVTVPPDHAAEMIAYDTMVGEFRVHYAGFFDPGFGHEESGGACSRAVLEVRSHEVPFTLEHGQLVGRLVYHRLAEVPDKIYGAGIGSSYQRQGLALAKQFKR